MRFSKLNLDDKIGIAQTAIENVRRRSYIMERIGSYEYNEERLDEGIGLIERIDKLSLDWNAAQSEKQLATRRLREARDQSAGMYKKTRQVARMVFRKQPHQIRALALENPTARSLAKYLEETNQFYTNALADPEIPENLSRFGISTARLKQEKRLLRELEKAAANQEKKVAEAMKITRERKETVKQLDQWMAEFFTILRLALGKTQWLEVAGITVK
jgi:hypothetical protein